MYNKNVKLKECNLNIEEFYMTTILSINCSNGLVIASDSQATMGAVKRSRENKIYHTKINNDINIVLAGSGTSAYTSRFLDSLEKNKGNRTINSTRDCADFCEDIIRGLKSNRYPDFNAHILICVSIKKDDKTDFCLYSLYPKEGVAEKEDNYDCIGSGSIVAEYILSRLWFPKIMIEQAMKIAIYAIEEVKKVDTYSGGYIRATVIDKNGVVALNLMNIANISSEIQKRDFELKDIWTKMVLFPDQWQKILEQSKKDSGQKKVQKNN